MRTCHAMACIVSEMILIVCLLFHIRTYDLCQIKHRHLRLTGEKYFKLVVCIDHAFVFTVLQALLFNVVPYLFNDIRTRSRPGADHICQCLAGCKRFQQCRIDLSFFGGGGFFYSLLWSRFFRGLFGSCFFWGLLFLPLF